MKATQNKRLLALPLVMAILFSVGLNPQGPTLATADAQASSDSSSGIDSVFKKIKGSISNAFGKDVTKAETDLAAHILGLAANFPGGQAHKPVAPTPADPIPASTQFEIRVIDGKKEIWATYPGGEQKIADTMTLLKGTPYSHWLPAEDAAILSAQGGYNNSEFEALYSASKVRPEAQGPGFYASLNPMDSSSYGPRGEIGYAPSDLTMAFSSQAYQATVNGVGLGGDISGIADRLRKIGVDGFIGSKDQNWMVFITRKAVAKLYPMTQDRLMDAVLVSNKRAAAIQEEVAASNVPTYSQGLQIINPIQAVQTYYMKGIGPQAPNDWTQKNTPAWDKMLRGQPLSDDERNEIDSVLVPKVNSPYNYNNGIGQFSKEDPHLLNFQNYMKEESKQIGGADAQKALSDFLAKEAPYDKAVSDYQNSPAYKTYTAAVQAYYQSPAYLAYQASNQTMWANYNKAMTAYMSTPEYTTYRTALTAYYTSPAFAAYQKATVQYQTNFQIWNQQHAANPNVPAPTWPSAPSAPTPPAGLPQYGPSSIAPVLNATVPPQPQLPEKPDPSQLTGDVARAYQFLQISNQSEQTGTEGSLVPTPLPTMTAEQQKALQEKVDIACIRRIFHFW
jgi:hypothetical protein